MRVLAVLTAAGSGTRLGHALPKALVPLHEEPLVAHAARRLLAACPGPDGAATRLVDELVVTAPADLVDAVRGAVAPVVADGVRLVVVPGGPTRQASVAAALAHLGDDDDAVVLVHDAARPWAPPELVARVVAAVAAGHDAVVPGLPVTDTVKRVGPADVAHAEPVRETVERSALRAVQTPQGFRLGLLRRAHDEAARHAHDERVAASDDAGLVERLGRPVWVVPGDERAAKITTARDLRVAELLGEDA
ncbi:2-C-methyl-D-erythritol 4-phosphate cytidylyltransferase [Cellulomonas sp. DKR-3]|uniref:2-C-methyl-D-erythritol 4-phosphate cytidylyltransferase n=1 Tax=Cellulomonas fulva TaxID=2835530 RepID=A0ABS5TVM3_9CELL|nr:2-C-methyl-D-erythritol 4-phosphate cytidylyltransferase [Cellulomonas fulva]MBT0993174.1 2-C-methyl-D-erythritol 4-phosphate cytidylyltransferase [Cellulomonas fulva]